MFSNSLHYDRTRIPQSKFKDGTAETGQSKRIQGGQIMSGNYHVQPRLPHHSLTRWGLAIFTGAALACTLFAGPIYAASEAKPSTSAPKREKLTIAAEEATKPVIISGCCILLVWSQGKEEELIEEQSRHSGSDLEPVE